VRRPRRSGFCATARFDVDPADHRILRADRRLDRLHRRCDLVGRRNRVELDVEHQQHVLGADVHGERPADPPDVRLAGHDGAHVAGRRRPDAFADQHPARFVDKDDGHPARSRPMTTDAAPSSAGMSSRWLA